MDLKWVQKEAESIKDFIIAIRRDIHQYPETGYEVFRTADKVAETLRSLGIEVRTEVGKTGVIGTLKGTGEGKTIALRADMDALDIDEKNHVEYKSKIAGKMHACGHDAHTAMLLGAAKILTGMKDKIKGNVIFVFQPAEEGPVPGGAKLILEEHLLDSVDGIFAMHVDPLLPTGKIAINRKEAMASTDFFDIVLKGKSGHAALPHKTIDAISMAGQLINSVQYIVSREIDPSEPGVISICKIKGGVMSAAIAEEVLMSGTIRALSQDTRELLLNRFEDMIRNSAQMYKGTYEYKLTNGYPPTINHEDMSEFVKNVCMQVIGKEHILTLDKPKMTGEDFSYYLQKIPGAFFWLGCGNKEKGIDKPLHHQCFDIDENALCIGTALHAGLAYEFIS